MNRALMVALLICTAVGGAEAQTVFNSFPNVPPPVPSPGGSVPNANASPLPQIAPGAPMVGSGASAPRARRPSSRIVQVPGYPTVVIPHSRRDSNSFSSRIERCIHYGSAAGIQPNDLGSFSAQCASR